MLISEVFGYGVDNLSDEAKGARIARFCRFRASPCTKSNKKDPLGVCSLSDGSFAASLCPVRFLEGSRIFVDAARIAFGPGVEVGLFPEVRVLKVEAEAEKRDRKIGKVDFLLGLIRDSKIIDFAALEVQAVYFSGGEIRTPMRNFIESGILDHRISDRRPDFRSSAQKRLIPQLQLKVPVFRRWGKKFFVVVDTQFLGALPKFPTTTEANSEVTWLSYPIQKSGNDYQMQECQVVFSQWDDVQNALREGTAPDPSEILSELQAKLAWPVSRRPKVISTG